MEDALPERRHVDTFRVERLCAEVCRRRSVQSVQNEQRRHRAMQRAQRSVVLLVIYRHTTHITPHEWTGSVKEWYKAPFLWPNGKYFLDTQPALCPAYYKPHQPISHLAIFLYLKRLPLSKKHATDLRKHEFLLALISRT